ncbi:unnamed protein product [Soboliphyme baturini]|uniref:Uncharacterized protein n=1 Tax=Soboliphyme baturini TaxID=241478 RepID=A0A183ITE1_9BILA|nr:unnamed protein product [Soboliphyme baturini]
MFYGTATDTQGIPTPPPRPLQRLDFVRDGLSEEDSECGRAAATGDGGGSSGSSAAKTNGKGFMTVRNHAQKAARFFTAYGGRETPCGRKRTRRTPFNFRWPARRTGRWDHGPNLSSRLSRLSGFSS